jgi:hypothetical protein
MASPFFTKVRELIGAAGRAHEPGEDFIKQVRQTPDYAVDTVVKLSHPFSDPRHGGCGEKVLLTGYVLGIIGSWMAQRRDGGGRTALLLGMEGVGKSVTTRATRTSSCPRGRAGPRPCPGRP